MKPKRNSLISPSPQKAVKSRTGPKKTEAKAKEVSALDDFGKTSVHRVESKITHAERKPEKMKMRSKKEDILQELVLADPPCLRKAPCKERHIGFGLFSQTPFHIGAYICEYKGEVITAVEADKRRHLTTNYQFYFQHNGAMLCIDAYELSNSGIARYANDEWKRPNAKVVKEVLNGTPHLFLKCIRPIAEGDEIRYDYNYKESFWRTDLKKGKGKHVCHHDLRENSVIGETAGNADLAENSVIGETAGNADLGENSVIGETAGNADLGENCVIGETAGNADLGENSVIGETAGKADLGENCVIGETAGNADLGENSVIGETAGNADLGENSVIGETAGNADLGENSVIGETAGNADLGENSVIGETAGNADLGENCVIGETAGNADLGENCVIGETAGVADLGENCVIGETAGVDDLGENSVIGETAGLADLGENSVIGETASVANLGENSVIGETTSVVYSRESIVIGKGEMKKHVPRERPVAIVDPARQMHYTSDDDAVDLDDDSVVLSSGSSYKPSDDSSESEDEVLSDWYVTDSETKEPVVKKRTLITANIGVQHGSRDDVRTDELPVKRRKVMTSKSNKTVPETSGDINRSGPATDEMEDVQGWKKSCFKNVHVQSYESKDGKRNNSKTAYCVYCGEEYTSRISKHLLAVHFTETRVKEIEAMELKTKKRKAALQKLLFEGNYKHNVKVLQKGEGTLIVYRRPAGRVNAYDYLPCQYCNGFFHSKLLWSHAKSCLSKINLNINGSEKNFIREAKCMLAPFLPREAAEVEMLNAIVTRMKETKDNPGLKRICENDELIREFGLYCIGRLGPVEEQRVKDQDNVSTKMRTLARLVKKLNENTVFEKPLTEFICSREFKNVAINVKELYQEAGSGQLGVNLGNYIKQCSFLKGSLALDKEDSGMKREADQFKEQYEAKWKSLVSSVANRSKRLRALNKRSELPVTEDLITLKDFLIREIKENMEKMSPNYTNYVYMAHVLIARIAIFNKRRISEVAELKKTDFLERLRGDELDTNSEVYNSLENSERTLLRRMELVEVRGKSTRGLRKVFVILDTEMVEGLQHLLMVRSQAGINPQNKYLFARTTDSPQDGCEAMRVVTRDCKGLLYPERIRTTKLRKYLATTTQIMAMTGDELKLLADHMGHSVAIHTEVYRLQTSVLERTKVARALVALEEGNLANYHGRSMSTIDIDEFPEPQEDDESESNDNAGETSVAETGEAGDADSLVSSDAYFRETNVGDAGETSRETSVVDKEEVDRHVPRGIRRKRWSKEEEYAISTAFKKQILEKKNANTEAIREAKKEYYCLRDRSEAVIRSKINNIILGKSKHSQK